jgi:hypothetical protein
LIGRVGKGIALGTPVNATEPYRLIRDLRRSDAADDRQ